VDVRTEREYEVAPMENAINVPLLSLIKNPFLFSENRDKTILLYCQEGYQSKAAAQCLLEAGYEKVAFFAKKERM
jgi:rhodanese-related sulfurtransferase